MIKLEDVIIVTFLGIEHFHLRGREKLHYVEFTACGVARFLGFGNLALIKGAESSNDAHGSTC